MRDDETLEYLKNQEALIQAAGCEGDVSRRIRLMETLIANAYESGVVLCTNLVMNEVAKGLKKND